MAHIHTISGQFDYTVAGYLVHDNKTLLIQHKTLPIWTAPAGHVELNESPIEALYKEISEEAGIDSSHLSLVETCAATANFKRGNDATYMPVPFDFEFHSITQYHRHINCSYILTSDTDIVEPGEGESQVFRWFNADELHEAPELSDTRANSPTIIQSAAFALNYIKEQQL